jgi:hypothetical protein
MYGAGGDHSPRGGVNAAAVPRSRRVLNAIRGSPEAPDFMCLKRAPNTIAKWIFSSRFLRVAPWACERTRPQNATETEHFGVFE